MHLFTQEILAWWQQNQRSLPWKLTDDAYTIWLSEVILQQTRIEQGLPYYLKFIEAYPTVIDLANAPQDEVMRHWEGLGYYARARNMHHTAQFIAAELNGIFPSTYAGIRQLKGVGDYTAAAIASFAFKLPHAVVDGNVYRLLSRCFGIETPIDTPQGKKQFAELAHELLNQGKPDLYNQAIMDFGSLQCKPVNPDCGQCPLQSICVAYRDNMVSELPVKLKKLIRKNRFLNYFLLHTPNNGWLLRKRTAKDIWQNLYEFLLIESENESAAHQEWAQYPDAQLLIRQYEKVPLQETSVFKQILTHQNIYARFFELRVQDVEKWLQLGFVEVAPEAIKQYAFPKIINNYLAQRR